MVILDALIEFVVFVIDCAIFLFWHGDQSHRASLLDQSPLESRARCRRIGLGCIIASFVLAVAIAILLIREMNY